jgi:hypothetical protein
MSWLLSLIPGLSGWKLSLLAFAAGVIAGGLLAIKVAGWQEAAAERDRLRVYAQGLQIINAANDAAAEVAAADAKRALQAAEAAAVAERERALDLEARLKAIRALPDVENCPLGLETMKLLEGLL